MIIFHAVFIYQPSNFYVMARINSISLGKARGSLGNVTVYSRMGQTIARQKVTDVNNPKTPAQCVTRSMISNPAKIYKSLTASMGTNLGAFGIKESTSGGKKLTAYQQFLKTVRNSNLKPMLYKDEAAARVTVLAVDNLFQGEFEAPNGIAIQLYDLGQVGTRVQIIEVQTALQIASAVANEKQLGSELANTEVGALGGNAGIGAVVIVRNLETRELIYSWKMLQWVDLYDDESLYETKNDVVAPITFANVDLNSKLWVSYGAQVIDADKFEILATTFFEVRVVTGIVEISYPQMRYLQTGLDEAYKSTSIETMKGAATSYGADMVNVKNLNVTEPTGNATTKAFSFAVSNSNLQPKQFFLLPKDATEAGFPQLTLIDPAKVTKVIGANSTVYTYTPVSADEKAAVDGAKLIVSSREDLGLTTSVIGAGHSVPQTIILE